MPKEHFRKNFEFSLKWEPWCYAIMSQHILRPGTFEEDTQQGTDSRWIKHGNGRIALRVRMPGNTDKYGREITITAKNENGCPCEFDKAIIEARANLMFYGWASHHDPRIGFITHWYFIDLDKARPFMIANKDRWPLAGWNRDKPGSRCGFFAYRPDEHFPEAIIAKWTPDTVQPANPALRATITTPVAKVDASVGSSLFAQMRASLL